VRAFAFFGGVAAQIVSDNLRSGVTKACFYCRHVNVGDQAGRFGETGGCEEIGRRWKGLDTMALGPHEPFHGLAEEPIIRTPKMPRSAGIAPMAFFAHAT
jgi:hypothetical protein